MPKNVMKLLKPSPHRSRNDFDLSHRHLFDANFGELLPATCLETVPGDNITLHASDLLRCIPFVSSPFLRAKQHLDVWFVPYHDLWHNFDQFITQKDEPVSSALGKSAYCPYFSLYSLYDSLTFASTNNYTDIAGRNLDKRSYYLLQLLGYGNVLNAHGTSSDSFKVNPFRLAAYNYIWYNEYRQAYYDDGTRLLVSGTSPAKLFNFDDLDCSTLANANIGSTGSSNRIAAMCQMRYRTWKKDLFTGLLPSTQFGLVSAVSVSGSGSVSITSPVTISGITGNDFNSHRLYTSGIQIDPSEVSQYIDSNEIPNVLTRSPLSSNHIYVGHLGSPEDGDPLEFSPFIRNTVDSGVVSDIHTHSFTGTGSVSGTGTISGTSFDVLALRRSEALQIWRENALRAGNRVKDNMMAHYGVASDFNDHRPVYLGSVSAPLNIGDIAVTANSSTGINDTVGDIAGKGLSSLDEKVFKFHAKDFGVIMVMFSMLPEAEYDAYGIDRCNQLLEKEDFFVPEFENLGLEAVSSVNFAIAQSGLPSQQGVQGYAPRYYAYKTKLDKVFGEFAGTGTFRTWASQRSDVTSQLSVSQSALPLTCLYINPSLFDANFAVGVDNSPQFLCDLYFDVDAIRPMSVVGLPFSS